MVYRGKPSRSCRQCRKRDIKCDKRKESCGQCTRAHLLCPGYPDPSKTIFADETESVVRKSHVQPRVPSPPELPLAFCVEDRAKEFFVSQYVFCKTGRFPYMEHFWLSRPRHAHLAACLRAVSLAFLFTELRSPEILLRARHQYSLSLCLTRTALQYPTTAKHNTTLLTVFLFYFYEKLVHQITNDFSGESLHLEAALTLLRLPGTSLVDDDVRLQLYYQISMSILLKCLRHGDDIPISLLSLRQSLDTVDQDARLEGLMIRFVILQSGIRKGQLQENQIYTEIKELDNGLAQIAFRPLKWGFAHAISGCVTDKELFIYLIEVFSTAYLDN